MSDESVDLSDCLAMTIKALAPNPSTHQIPSTNRCCWVMGPTGELWISKEPDKQWSVRVDDDRGHQLGSFKTRKKAITAALAMHQESWDRTRTERLRTLADNYEIDAAILREAAEVAT